MQRASSLVRHPRIGEACGFLKLRLSKKKTLEIRGNECDSPNSFDFCRTERDLKTQILLKEHAVVLLGILP